MTLARIARNTELLHATLSRLEPVGLLVLRCWVAWVFLKSGWLKFTGWDSTLFLFENEFHVPLLPPELAAYLGTFVELVFPTLLIAGLAGRFSALVLFVFNIVAVISYPDLDANGINDHAVWGVMLLVATLSGPGRLSLDCLIRRRIAARA